MSNVEIRNKFEVRNDRRAGVSLFRIWSFGFRILSCLASAAVLLFCVLPAFSAEYDLIIRNGMVYNGSGNLPFKADIAVREGKIKEIAIEGSGSTLSTLKTARAKTEIDATGLAVA